MNPPTHEERQQIVDEWRAKFHALDEIVDNARSALRKGTEQLVVATEIEPLLLKGLSQLEPSIDDVRREANSEFNVKYDKLPHRENAWDVYLASTRLGQAVGTIDAKRRPVLRLLGEIVAVKKGDESFAVHQFYKILTSKRTGSVPKPLNGSMCEKIGTYKFLDYIGEGTLMVNLSADRNALNERMHSWDSNTDPLRDVSKPLLFDGLYLESPETSSDISR